MRRSTALCRPLFGSAAMLVALLAASGLAAAQSKRTPSPMLELNAPPPADTTPLSEEEQAALRDALNTDPLSDVPQHKAARTPQKTAAPNLDWSRADKPDGSAAVSVKRPLPLAWDAKIGADFGLAPPTGAVTPLERPLPSTDQSTGAAWANFTVPGIASIDARGDTSRDQRKLGTTLSRSVPIGSNYSVTLQGSLAVIEPTAPATGLPSAAAPGTPSQVWSNDRTVKFDIRPTGTTLSAGTASSTADSIQRHKFSAEQKLFGPLSVTTSVTDVGAPTASKSIAAGLRWKW